MISSTILLVSILTVVGSLEPFALIDVLTQRGPSNSTTVLVYYLYRQAFELNEFGHASGPSGSRAWPQLHAHAANAGAPGGQFSRGVHR